MTLRLLSGTLTLLLVSCAGSATNGEVVVLAGKRFQVEVVDSPEEQARGLMFREELAADAGMLFVYATAEPQAFWMKNTRLPLDILFFDNDARYIGAQVNVPICRGDPCPTYAGPAPARYILELNAGRAEALELKPGDRLRLPESVTREATRP